MVVFATDSGVCFREVQRRGKDFVFHKRGSYFTKECVKTCIELDDNLVLLGIANSDELRIVDWRKQKSWSIKAP